jgi:hypothetical protein
MDDRIFAGIFETVKRLAKDYIGTEQAGILLGVSDLGVYGNNFIGAYYSPFANTIVLNKLPLEIMKKRAPELFDAYLLMLMLHEYIHSLGYPDEKSVRDMVRKILSAEYGAKHPAAVIAGDLERFLPAISHGLVKEPESIEIRYVTGIDRKNTNYIM